MNGESATTILEKAAGPISRRNFLQSLAAGAAGAALTSQLTSKVLAAGPGVFGSGNETGEVVLDGLMITYFDLGGANPSSFFTFGQNFSSTFSLRLPKSPGIELTATVPDVERPQKGAYLQHAS
ncbi:MAG TPA: twin-arginine translocation signal domain-containing protein, partial [Blastocatellia bacterium]